MKSAYTLGLLLIAAASAGAQGTKAPAKPDTSKKTATSTAKPQAAAPGTKQAPPPANAKQPEVKQANTAKQPDSKTAAPGTKTVAPGASKAADTKVADTKQATQGTKAPGTKAPDTKQAAPAPAPQAVTTPTIMREVYTYAIDGRRDPFVSLLSSSDLRPTVADLRLTGILYDENGSSSIAIMRDVTDNKQYRVVTGQTLGRMKVALIKRKTVIFSIEEFGLNRQDSLVLGDTTKARAK